MGCIVFLFDTHPMAGAMLSARRAFSHMIFMLLPSQFFLDCSELIFISFYYGMLRFPAFPFSFSPLSRLKNKKRKE